MCNSEKAMASALQASKTSLPPQREQRLTIEAEEHIRCKEKQKPHKVLMTNAIVHLHVQHAYLQCHQAEKVECDSCLLLIELFSLNQFPED